MEIETKNYVLICNKIDSITSKQMKQFEIENFSITVELFINEIAKFFNLDKNCFDVVCFGQLLDYSNTLESYGIENGTLLYLRKKKLPQSPTSSASIESESSGLTLEHQGHCLALRSALMTPKFRNIIKNLADFDNRENLITINRELRNDPSIFGLIGDAELLLALISKDNIKKVLKKYPNFLEVLCYASASFHEEMTTMSSNSRNMGYRGSSINYSIDAISEDDDDALLEDEEETSSISSANTNNSERQLSDSQSFSNMLMQAYNHQRRQRHRQRQRQQDRPIITADMLSQALQSTSSTSSSNADLTQTCETIPNVPNVAASSSNNNNNNQQESSDLQPSSSSDCIAQPPQPPSGPPQPDNRTTAQILIGYAPQLRQMRELGINDDIVAIQALEATNGDVQAAINIIFSDMN